MEIEQNIFFDEFKNKLISLENAIIEIRTQGFSHENIDEMFRAIHTIKGTADLLGMFEIVSLTHKAEDLLQFIRDEKIQINDEICELLLELKRFISILVDNVAQGIFDDSSSEKLFNSFENELTHQIYLAQNREYEQSEVQTILVIDDSAIVRYLIKKVASDKGYNVLTTDNVEDGWTKIQENAVDLLFCDFTTPYEKNLNLAELIRTDFSYKTLPIVMLLPRDCKDINIIAKKIEAKAWLGKPLDGGKVALVLEKILTKK